MQILYNKMSSSRYSFDFASMTLFYAYIKSEESFETKQKNKTILKVFDI